MAPAKTMPDLSIPALQAAYAAGGLTPSAVLTQIYPRLAEDPAMFVSLVPLPDVLQRCRELEALPAGARGPLHGVPCAVKDNIDYAPLPTTAGCAAFAYRPQRSAFAVQALLDAGAVVVGKTNMDQFATGLVGTRSPYGTPRNVFDARFIPGGSSSGSGPAVGGGYVSFALGTDTAGSGRIPAGFNGCVGVKPTVGRVSTTGVVPACRALDCVTVFARSVADGALVVRVMEAAGQVADPGWRWPRPPGNPGAPSWAPAPPGAFRFALPGPEFADFSGPGGPRAAAAYKALFEAAAARLEALGGARVAVDFAPFADTARLLYESAFVAERLSATRQFLLAGKAGPLTAEGVAADGRLERVIGTILAGACKFGAADVYDGTARLAQLAAAARAEMTKVDLLLVPTALHHYLVQEVEATEKVADQVSWPYNSNLGRFTNFVNLLDMAAVAVPSGILRHPAASSAAPGQAGAASPAAASPAAAADGAPSAAEAAVAARAAALASTGSAAPVLPFGVTLIGAAWSDERLWDVAAAFEAATGLGCGPPGHGVQPYRG